MTRGQFSSLFLQHSAREVGQAHPLKDHPISVADIQEPPTILLSSSSSRKVTEPLSVCGHVGMRVVGVALILLAGAFPLLSLLRPISKERDEEEHPLISRGIAKKSTASFQHV